MLNKKNIVIINLIGIFIIGSTLFILFNGNSIVYEYSNSIYEEESNNNDVHLADQGFINSSKYEIFWFIHIADTQHLWYDDDLRDDFDLLLDESYKEIDPLLIYNTGDLVGSDYEHFFIANERDQRKEEWKRYKEHLDDNDMNESIYMDLLGNHDAYGDPGYSYFLKYSMMGSTKHVTQYAFKRKFPFGSYAFIGLNTVEEYGAKYPFAVFGYLSSEELDWYEGRLEKYKDCEKIFVFGHHPPFEMWSTPNSNGKEFLKLNEEYGVFSYLCGHGHYDSFQNVNGMLALMTPAFNRKGGSYRIVAVDENHLSTSIQEVGDWPQGIITYPPREDYINENLDDDELKKIRALAWDPKGINSVEWAAYDISGNKRITEWKSLKNATINGPLYEGRWDLDLNDGNDYLIKVKIEGGSGEIIEEIYFSCIKSPFMHLYHWVPIIFISFFAFVALIIVITYYRRTHIPKYKKREEQLVDKKLRNLFLLKCLIFLFVPLTLAGMYKGHITAVFALFFLNELGLIFNILLLMAYTFSTFMFCIFWQGFNLSYEKRKKLTAFIIQSIAWLGFITTFYILHYPTLSWISPGLYGMAIVDILMFQRNKEMKLLRQNDIKLKEKEKGLTKNKE